MSDLVLDTDLLGDHEVQESILVVDDEPQIRMLISRFLQSSGYEVEAAGNGLLALAKLQERPFSLVLSDLKMPRMDGTAFLEAMRKEYPDTIFILMTAFATIDSAVSVLRHGAYDYLTKPLDLQDLLSTVQRALEHHTLVVQNKRLLRFLKEKNLILEKLNREEQRKSEQLNRVNAIAQQITAILDVETLMSTVMDLVRPAFDFAAMSFGLIEGQDLIFRGGALDGHTEHVRGSFFWQITGGGRDMVVRSGDEPSADRSPYDLIFPLVSGEQTVGFWVADWRPDALYREQDLPYLDSLAAQTVVVLENARLYALARQADELAFLNEVGRAANESLDLEATIESVLTCVHVTFNTSVVELSLFKVSSQADGEKEIEQVFSLVKGSFQRCDRPLLGLDFVRQVERDSMSIRGHADMGSATVSMRSLLGVLLRFGQQGIGVLGVGHPGLDAYDMEDGRLLQVVGGQVSTAIQNARLFEAVETGRQVILQSRNTLQTLFDGILEGIYIVDREKTILAINRTHASWVQRDFADLVGKPMHLAFPVSQRLLRMIDTTFHGGEPQSCAERQRRADGRWTEWEIHTYPIVHADRVSMDGFASPGEMPDGRSPREAAGEPRSVERVVVMVRDVTEQRWLEAAVMRSEKLASVGRLAAGLAHEINNPMTVISANIQILCQEIPTDHPYYGSLQLIDRASERTSKIVRNLLDFSRTEQFEFVSMDLNRSLCDAIALVAPQTRKLNIEIVSELASDLPPIDASPDHLNVLWLNLLLNARDAIEDAAREGCVRVTSQRRGDWVIVQISDNGVGIAPDMVKQIYDPFFTTKPPGKGTGLGLFTCYRIVDRHGGQIDLDSQVEVGTSFEISLPIHQDALSDL